MKSGEKIDFTQSRNYANVITASTHFLHQNFKVLAKLLFFSSVPLIALGFILNSKFFFYLISLLNPESHKEFQLLNDPYYAENWSLLNYWPDKQFFLFITLLLLALGTVGIVNIIQTSLIEYQKKEAIDTSDIKDILRASLQSLANMAGTFALLNLLTFLFYFLFYHILKVNNSSDPALILQSVCLSYLSIPLSFIFIVRMQEQEGFLASIKRCFYLVRDYWWSTLGLYLISGMILFSLAYPILLINLLSVFMIEIFAMQSIHVVDILLTILKTIVFTTSVTLFCTIICFQYYNLEEIKDQKGLKERIKEIGK